jgi:ribosome-binding factor A
LTTPEVKLKRAESALYERVCEAIASLNDEELAALSATYAELAKDRRDATIFLDAGEIAEGDQPRLIAKLKRASGYISRYIVASEGWRKSPVLHFKFTAAIAQNSRLDALFAEIAAKKQEK